MHIHFRDSHCCFVICQKDVNQSNGGGGMVTACTKFLYTKDSLFMFQLFVSQVLFCKSTRINAVVLLHFSGPLSSLYLGVILMVVMSLLGCFSPNISHLLMLLLPSCDTCIQIKRTFFVITLSSHSFLFLSSLYHPSSSQ